MSRCAREFGDTRCIGWCTSAADADTYNTSKWSIPTDLNGITIGWTIAAANRNDSVLLAPTLDDAAGRGLLREMDTPWLDRGYDSHVTRERLTERGITDPVIARKRRPGFATPTA